MDAKQITDSLYRAFDYFNQHLWNSALQRPAIVIYGRPNKLGQFSSNKFLSEDGYFTHELAMSPYGFNRSSEEILATLVHEMVHLWEEQYGEPSPHGYHSKQWGAMMRKVGLYPSSTGEPGGNEVGKKMSHYIISGGKFELVASNFLRKYDFNIDNHSPVVDVRNKSRKVKYACGCKSPWYANFGGRSAVCSGCGQEIKENI